MSDKPHRVQVTLDVYGCANEQEVHDFLDEALAVDGLILVSKGKCRGENEDHYLDPSIPGMAGTPGY